MDLAGKRIVITGTAETAPMYDGIKVSVLCPQPVRTAMTAANPGGVASINSAMELEELVEVVVQGLAAKTFLIPPHPKVLDYMRNNTADYDRWSGGSRNLNLQFCG